MVEQAKTPIKRRKSRKIKIGNISVGGDSPVTVQSMTKTDTNDVKKTIEEINSLEKEGCEIIRVAVKNESCAKKLKSIKNEINIPLIADIHFDYKLAIEAIKQGVDGLRLNPGNIKDKEGVKKVANFAKEKNIPIRIGVNAGSISDEIKRKYNGITPNALIESAMQEINLLEKEKFYQIKVSLKATDIFTTISAYKILAKKVDYPFHLGITETGTFFSGTIKSTIGIGCLLLDGIGDTIRVSLTDDSKKEVKVGKEILKNLGLRNFGPQIISCPTCGRCKVNLFKIVNEVEKKIFSLKDNPLKIAIMGCEVNGPGEAKEADIGVVCGKNFALLMKNGIIKKRIKIEEIVSNILDEIRNYN